MVTEAALRKNVRGRRCRNFGSPSLGGLRLDLYLPRFVNVSESIRGLESPCGALVQTISEFFARISTN